LLRRLRKYPIHHSFNLPPPLHRFPLVVVVHPTKLSPSSGRSLSQLLLLPAHQAKLLLMWRQPAVVTALHRQRRLRSVLSRRPRASRLPVKHRLRMGCVI
jgi:hypothetical protein